MRNIGLEHISVGSSIEELRNFSDKCVVSMTGTLNLCICLRGITSKEVEQCQCGNFEIGLSEVNGILFITFNMDGVIKAETAFNANLCDRDSVKNLGEFREGVGYGCTIIGVDSDTGIIKSLRVVGLGTEFSNELNNYMKEQLEDEGFNESRYKINSYRVLAEYSSDDIFKVQKYVYTHKRSKGR